MKRLALLLCLISSSAVADCYMRSDIKLSRQAINASPTDIQRMVTPEPNGHKCVARYRVYVNNEWVTAEGTATAKTETEACARAQDLGRGYILAEVTPDRITTTNQMVCSDLPDIRVRPVNRGELIWESETDMHSHPRERAEPYFQLKHATCRKFIERANKDQNLIVYQGIICQANTGANSKWIVLDKY
jgi:hypothetical protein